LKESEVQREMNKALFVRKAVDLEELKNRTGQERNKSYFVVEAVIELSEDNFRVFADDLLLDFDFIKDSIEKMYIDSDRIWHCLLVKALGSKDGILIEAEGYGYARYSAYCPNLSQIKGLCIRN
jgi:hypothetical protein